LFTSISESAVQHYQRSSPGKTTWRPIQNKEEKKFGQRFSTKMHYLEDYLEREYIQIVDGYLLHA
jgi:hypothetical protein